MKNSSYAQSNTEYYQQNPSTVHNTPAPHFLNVFCSCPSCAKNTAFMKTSSSIFITVIIPSFSYQHQSGPKLHHSWAQILSPHSCHQLICVHFCLVLVSFLLSPQDHESNPEPHALMLPTPVSLMTQSPLAGYSPMLSPGPPIPLGLSPDGCRRIPQNEDPTVVAM